jgi:hypothetical protein
LIGSAVNGATTTKNGWFVLETYKQLSLLLK